MLSNKNVFIYLHVCARVWSGHTTGYLLNVCACVYTPLCTCREQRMTSGNSGPQAWEQGPCPTESRDLLQSSSFSLAPDLVACQGSFPTQMRTPLGLGGTARLFLVTF